MLKEPERYTFICHDANKYETCYFFSFTRFIHFLPIAMQWHCSWCQVIGTLTPINLGLHGWASDTSDHNDGVRSASLLETQDWEMIRNDVETIPRVWRDQTLIRSVTWDPRGGRQRIRSLHLLCNYLSIQLDKLKLTHYMLYVRVGTTFSEMTICASIGKPLWFCKWLASLIWIIQRGKWDV